MRRLIVILFLLLLLPIGFGISVQADETDPPVDPGTEDDADVEGDHPWGGEERVVVVDDNTISKYDKRSAFTIDDYIKIYVYLYYGLDFLDQRTTEYIKPVSITRHYPSKRSSYRAVSQTGSSR